MTARFLKKVGFGRVVVCNDSMQAIELMQKEAFCTVLLDLNMPKKNGEELLKEIGRAFPDIPIIIITGLDETDSVVRCIKAGAFDYLVKPIELNRLHATVNAAIEVFSLRTKVKNLVEKGAGDRHVWPSCFDKIVTQHPAMFELFKYIEAICKTPFPVLVLGETGTGKELFAHAIHKASGRTGKFVAVNVAGLDDNLFTDTIFGHVRGAFSGADRQRKGMVDQAQGGTLFLDEIGDLYPHSQVKLLRLIQEGEYYPIGSDKKINSDARIVAATNSNLKELIDKKEFRSDLYHRISAHVVKIPPLRERLEDLPLLTKTFTEEAKGILKISRSLDPDKILKTIEVEALSGNIRELRSIVFDLVARNNEAVFESTPELNNALTSYGEPEESPSITHDLHFKSFPTLKQAEETMIQEALRLSEGKQGQAAKLLGISRQALNQRLIRKKTTK